jgi:hypothetical protein
MSKVDQSRIKMASKQIEQATSYFGSDKARVDFTIEISQSIDRYEAARRDNLFAIIMPSCSGKTIMCDKYGFIDVDRCCWGSEHEILNDMRLDCIAGKREWQTHNDLWIEWVNITLDDMHIMEPKIIMCHSEPFALAIGALPLVGLCPDDVLFAKTMLEVRSGSGNAKKANEARALLATANRAQFLSHSNLIMKNKRTFSSYLEMEQLVIRTLVINDLPCACPYRWQEKFTSSAYDSRCPEWVTSGDKDKLDVDQLLGLYSKGMVPKECLDYFLSHRTIPASFGFGFTPNDWSEFIAKARVVRSVPQRLDRSKDPRELFPYYYKKNENRANITMSRLIKGMQVYDDPDIYEILSHHIGKPNNFVSAIVCYWVGIGSKLKSAKIVKQLLCTSYYHWADLMKEFHSKVRLSVRLLDVDITEMERQSLMYLALLLGKEVEEADYVQEIKDRTCDDPKPDHRAFDPDLGMWTVRQYETDFSNALDEAYLRLRKRNFPEISGFEGFYKLRSLWLAKGSTVYNDLDREMLKCAVDVVDEVGRLIRSVNVRHNKKSLFEVVHALREMRPNFELLNVTKMVTKLDECGHTKRALFPGSLMHYIVFCYVLFCAEQQGQVGNVRLNAPPDDDISYFEEKMTQLPRLLFDWANFNAYHSTNEMSEVIRRLGAVVKGPEHYADFCWVIADQMYNMKFLDPEGNMHDLGRGLYSGWRGTTFINTVLNFVYVRCAEESFIRIWKYEPFVYVDGGGDDLDTGLMRHNTGYRMLEVMERMNFKGKKIKQMIDTKSEFFRNTIRLEGCFASPTRALAMFVNGKWEGSGDVPVNQRIGGILDQIAKIVRRGMDKQFGNTLAVLCLSHWCKVNKEGEWLDIPPEIVHGQLEQNGLGVPDIAGNVWILSETVPDPNMPEAVGSVPGCLASMDYLSQLCKEVSEYGIEVTNRGEIAAQLAADSFDIYDKIDFEPLLLFRGSKIGERPAVDMSKHNDELWDGFVKFMEVYRKNQDMGRLERFAALAGNIRFNGRSIEFNKLIDVLGLKVRKEVLEFSSDVYYRRLLSEPIAKAVTDFCMEAINEGVCEVSEAKECFRTLAVMASKRFEFHM